QRAAAPAPGLRAGHRLRGHRGADHGDRLLLPGHRPAAARRGQLERLPADAGHLPGDHLRCPARQPHRGPGHGASRSPGPGTGGTMTATLPIAVEPAALPEEGQTLGRWKRLPLKAKFGVVLLGVFVLAAIIGPMVTPYDPSFQNPSPSLSM